MVLNSPVAKSAMVGVVSVLAVITVMTVLLIGALAAQALAQGSALPPGSAPGTFFFGGAWIDLAIVILLAFASGFLLTLRHLNSARG